MINVDNQNSLKMMPRMSFSQVSQYLGDRKSDSRSIKKWCIKNNVYFFRDGNTHYVIQQEFLHKANCDHEKVMIAKYGKNWEENMQSSAQPEVQDSDTITHLNKNKYKAQAAEARNFAQKWKDL